MIKSSFGTTVIFCVLLLVVTTGCVTTVRQHPEFAERINRIPKIAIMPVESEIVLIKLDGRENIEDEQKRVCSLTPTYISHKLEEQGFEIGNNCLDGKNSDTNTDLRFKTTHIFRNVKEVIDEMYKELNMDEKKALNYEKSLGSQVNILADQSASDALIFTYMYGFRRAMDETLKDIAVGIALGVLTGTAVVPNQSGAIYIVVLVDGTTGDILWANAARGTTTESKEKEIKAMIDCLFEKFPKTEKLPQ